MLPLSVDSPLFIPGLCLLMAGTFGMVVAFQGMAAMPLRR